jgi:hypothetical protein
MAEVITATAAEKRQVLKEIEHCAEMELYFGAKVLRTPIEESREDKARESLYTTRRLEKESIAKRMGIYEDKIEEARCNGYYKANETVLEADNNGWWD